MIDKLRTSKYLRAMKRNLLFPLVVLLALCFTVLCLECPATAGEVQEANPGRGGETLDIRTLPVPGRVTVIDFYSPYCPQSAKWDPLLERLAQRRPDLVIKKVNINRPEVRGITGARRWPSSTGYALCPIS